MKFLIVAIATLTGATWVGAETIDVKYCGQLDLNLFACTDITRSSFIKRACYDKVQQFVVVQLNATYYPYCEMPAGIYANFLAADSMGRFYNANIKSTGSNGPYDCRTHRKPTY